MKRWLTVAILLLPFAAWITHIWFCVKHHEIGMLVAGALFFPLGVLHGLCLWLGFWH